MNSTQQIAYEKLIGLRKQREANISHYSDHILKISVITEKYAFLIHNNTEIGYVVWADTVRESLIRLHNFRKPPFFMHEWTEGYISLILEICTIPGMHKEAASAIRKFLISKKLFAVWRRNQLTLKTVKKKKITTINLNMQLRQIVAISN